MKTQYIIQLTNQENYPFDGSKEGCSRVTVRTSFQPPPQTYLETHAKIHAMLGIKSSALMQILKVIETKGKKFEIDYEYVGQSLRQSPKITETSFVSTFRETMSEYCRCLIENGIKQQIKFEDIGVSQSGELKIYLGLDFQLVSAEQQQHLEEEYQGMIQRMMDSHFSYRETLKSPSDHTIVSDYSHRVNKKLTELEDRLNKVRKPSRHSQHSSQHSHSSKPEQKHQSKNILKDFFASKTVKKNTVATNLTSTSFILQKNAEQSKPHKFSIGECETNSYRLDDSSSKESSLTKRIYSALEKTEFAFKVYEKYSRRKSRKRS